MVFAHYKWLDEVHPCSLFTGEPSRRIFDPYNGDQVLFLINYYLTILGRSSLSEARMLENRIAHTLPPDTRSEHTVLHWLIGDVTGSFKEEAR